NSPWRRAMTSRRRWPGCAARIKIMGGLEGPPKPPSARRRPGEAGTPLDTGDWSSMRGLEGGPPSRLSASRLGRNGGGLGARPCLDAIDVHEGHEDPRERRHGRRDEHERRVAEP